MPIMSLTQERYNKLKEDYEIKKKELEILKNTTPKDMWITDLDKVKELNKIYNDKLQKLIDSETVQKSEKKKKRKDKA